MCAVIIGIPVSIITFFSVLAFGIQNSITAESIFTGVKAVIIVDCVLVVTFFNPSLYDTISTCSF